MIHFSSEPLLVACALNSKFVCVCSNAVYLIRFKFPDGAVCICSQCLSIMIDFVVILS